VALAPTDLFEHSDVVRLARYISDRWGSQLAAAQLPPEQPRNGTPAVEQQSAAPEKIWSAMPAGRDLRSLLNRLICEILRMPEERIDHDRPFSDYGLDSILAVDLVRQLGQELGMAVPTTVLFDFPTVARLAAHLTDLTAREDAPAGRATSGDVAVGGAARTVLPRAEWDSALVDELAAGIAGGRLSMGDVLEKMELA
jgi:acyl carrier protein